MRILVTGGAGFIGANLCARLLDEGHEVFCLDNFYSSTRENVSDLEAFEGFKLVEHDLLEDFGDVFGNEGNGGDGGDDGGFDEIYHLACPASPPRYQKDHIYTLRTNFEGTLRVLELARQLDERSRANGSGRKCKVLFTSTSEVYGDPLVDVQGEEYRGNVNPHGVRSCYDEGKRVAESLCMNYARQFGVDVKIVRIFNTYGPKMDPNDGRVVSNFVVQALKGKALTIYGDGGQTRSFQYIDDLLEGMVRYMALDGSFAGPINLGNPEEITVLELANKINEEFGGGLKMEFKELPEDDPIRRCPDIGLAKEKLGWEPRVGVDEGLKKTIEYFRGR